MDDIREVLEALKADQFKQGSAWEKAHALAQRHEGIRLYDLLHALVHRIEGDELNARYWYRRAGEPVFIGDIEAESERLFEMVQ